MAIVDASMPIDLEGHSRDEVLLDIEFKFTHDDDLIFKQVRPFLISSFNLTPDVPIAANPETDIDENGEINAHDLLLFLHERGEVVEVETEFR